MENSRTEWGRYISQFWCDILLHPPLFALEKKHIVRNPLLKTYEGIYEPLIFCRSVSPHTSKWFGELIFPASPVYTYELGQPRHSIGG